MLGASIIRDGLWSGCLLDVDVEGLAWFEEHRRLIFPKTRLHRTRSGGLHLLFRHHVGLRCSAGRIAPGVDVRGDGGFVIWWPREGFGVEGREPAPWPDWLLRLAQKPKAPAFKGETPTYALCGAGVPVSCVSPNSREGRYAQAALRNAFADLHNWPRINEGGKWVPKRGGRNDMLNKLAFKMGGLIANGWIEQAVVARMLMLGAKDCGLVKEDGQERCALTIQSGLQAGIALPYPELRPLYGGNGHAAEQVAGDDTNVGVSYHNADADNLTNANGGANKGD
jgi:hypothetical protein